MAARTKNLHGLTTHRTECSSQSNQGYLFSLSDAYVINGVISRVLFRMYVWSSDIAE